ncbi:MULTISPECIES: hypothetical protein [Acidiphilium]|uniref:hypothetical protein n=1 Tax=Acidiphilium TaxID=522 RepID=UPI00257D160D|nr:MULTISPECIES: hypothetical protein [Acidiphilium]HQT84922.1 hypothetical protein [Acidiphilium rubrum]
MINNTTIFDCVIASVKEYTMMSGNLEDNELPEAFLGPSVSSALYKRAPEYCYDSENNFEKTYLKINRNALGSKLSRDVIGGYRADIAIFQRDYGKRSALIPTALTRNLCPISSPD